MFHVHDDKRTRRSAELIWEGLKVCLDEKSLDEVTVSDLQRASGVARTTFYRSFDNVADVPAWKCDEAFAECFGSYQREAYGGELDLARHYFSYWTSGDHSDILALLIDANRLDLIYECHLRNARTLVERFGEIPGPPDEHGRYFMASRIGFTIGILTAWLQGGRAETPDEMVGIVVEQIRLLVQELYGISER